MWYVLIVVLFLILLLGLIYTAIQVSFQRLPIFALYMALAVLTLGLAPAIAYLLQYFLPPEQVLQPMPIAASVYFKGAIPVLLAIALALVRGRKKSGFTDQELFEAVSQSLQQQRYLPFWLMGFGVGMYFVNPFLPLNLRQIGAFGELVLWVGVLHLLLSGWSWVVKTIFCILIFIFLIYKALQSTMFGDLFVWPLWMMLYLQTRHRWSTQVLSVAGGLTLIGLVFVLLWKYDYRQRLEHAGKDSRPKVLSHTLKDWAKHPLNSRRWQQALDRFNQGNHLAQVYNWVPAQEPYARGETFLLAIKASLVPRFIWPDKPQAGGIHIWYRFTGNLLSPNVSMNIGIPGEAYANFGPYWAIVIVFLWARFLHILYVGLRKVAFQAYPLLWLWVPLLFYPLMDQENDLLTMLNHAVKGTLFVLCFCWCLHKIQRFLPKLI